MGLFDNIENTISSIFGGDEKKEEEDAASVIVEEPAIEPEPKPLDALSAIRSFGVRNTKSPDVQVLDAIREAQGGDTKLMRDLEASDEAAAKSAGRDVWEPHNVDMFGNTIEYTTDMFGNRVPVLTDEEKAVKKAKVEAEAEKLSATREQRLKEQKEQEEKDLRGEVEKKTVTGKVLDFFNPFDSEYEVLKDSLNTAYEPLQKNFFSFQDQTIKPIAQHQLDFTEKNINEDEYIIRMAQSNIPSSSGITFDFDNESRAELRKKAMAVGSWAGDISHKLGNMISRDGIAQNRFYAHDESYRKELAKFIKDGPLNPYQEEYKVGQANGFDYTSITAQKANDKLVKEVNEILSSRRGRPTAQDKALIAKLFVVHNNEVRVAKFIEEEAKRVAGATNALDVGRYLMEQGDRSVEFKNFPSVTEQESILAGYYEKALNPAMMIEERGAREFLASADTTVAGNKTATSVKQLNPFGGQFDLIGGGFGTVFGLIDQAVTPIKTLGREAADLGDEFQRTIEGQEYGNKELIARDLNRVGVGPAVLKSVLLMEKDMPWFKRTMDSVSLGATQAGGFENILLSSMEIAAEFMLTRGITKGLEGAGKGLKEMPKIKRTLDALSKTKTGAALQVPRTKAMGEYLTRSSTEGLVFFDVIEKLLGDESGLSSDKVIENFVANTVFNSIFFQRGIRSRVTELESTPIVKEFLENTAGGDSVLLKKSLELMQEALKKKNIKMSATKLKEMVDKGMLNQAGTMAKVYKNFFDNLAGKSEAVRGAVLDSVFLMDNTLAKLSEAAGAGSKAKTDAKEKAFNIVRKKISSFVKKVEEGTVTMADAKEVMPIVEDIAGAVFKPVTNYKNAKMAGLSKIFDEDALVAEAAKGKEEILALNEVANNRAAIETNLRILEKTLPEGEMGALAEELTAIGGDKELDAGTAREVKNFLDKKVNEVLPKKAVKDRAAKTKPGDIVEEEIPSVTGTSKKSELKTVDDLLDPETGKVKRNITEVRVDEMNDLHRSEIAKMPESTPLEATRKAQVTYMKDASDANKVLSMAEQASPTPSAAEVKELLNNPAIERMIAVEDIDDIISFILPISKARGANPYRFIRNTLLGRLVQDKTSATAILKNGGLTKFRLKNFVRQSVYDTSARIDSLFHKDAILMMLDDASKAAPLRASRIYKEVEDLMGTADNFYAASSSKAKEQEFLRLEQDGLLRTIRAKSLKGEPVLEETLLLRTAVERNRALAKESLDESLAGLEDIATSPTSKKLGAGLQDVVDDIRAERLPARSAPEVIRGGKDAKTYSTNKEIHERISDLPQFDTPPSPWIVKQVDEDIIPSAIPETPEVPAGSADVLQFDDIIKLDDEEKVVYTRDLMSKYTDAGVTEAQIEHIIDSKTPQEFLQKFSDTVLEGEMSKWGSDIADLFETAPNRAIGMLGGFGKNTNVSKLIKEFEEAEAKELRPSVTPFFVPWQNILNRTSEGQEYVTGMGKLRVSLDRAFNFVRGFRRSNELLRKSGFTLNKKLHKKGFQDLIERMRELKGDPDLMARKAAEYGIDASSPASTKVYKIASKEAKFDVAAKGDVTNFKSMSKKEQSEILRGFEDILNLLHRADNAVIANSASEGITLAVPGGNVKEWIMTPEKYIDSIILSNAHSAVTEGFGGFEMLKRLVGTKGAGGIIKDIESFRKRFWSHQMGAMERVAHMFGAGRRAITMGFAVENTLFMAVQDAIRLHLGRKGLQITRRAKGGIDSAISTADEYLLLDDLGASLPRVDKAFSQKILNLAGQSEFEYVHALQGEGMIGALKEKTSKGVKFLKSAKDKAVGILTSPVEETTRRYTSMFTVDIWNDLLANTVFKNVEGMHKAMRSEIDDVTKNLANATFKKMDGQVKAMVTNIMALDANNPLFRNTWDRMIAFNFFKKWMGRITGTLNNAMTKYTVPAVRKMKEGNMKGGIQDILNMTKDAELVRIFGDIVQIQSYIARIYDRGDDTTFRGVEPGAIKNISTIGMLYETMPGSSSIKEGLDTWKTAGEQGLDTEEKFKFALTRAFRAGTSSVLREAGVYTNAALGALARKERFESEPAQNILFKGIMDALFFSHQERTDTGRSLDAAMHSPFVGYLQSLIFSSDASDRARNLELLRDRIFEAKYNKENEALGFAGSALNFIARVMGRDPASVARSFQRDIKFFDKKFRQFMSSEGLGQDIERYVMNGEWLDLLNQGKAYQKGTAYFKAGGTALVSNNEALALAVANDFSVNKREADIISSNSELQKGIIELDPVTGMALPNGEGQLADVLKADQSKLVAIAKKEWLQDLDESPEKIAGYTVMIRHSWRKERKELLDEVKKVHRENGDSNSYSPSEEAAVEKLLFDKWAPLLSLVDRPFRFLMVKETIVREMGIDLSEDKKVSSRDPAIERADFLLKGGYAQKQHGLFINKDIMNDYSWMIRKAMKDVPEKSLDKLMGIVKETIDVINTNPDITMAEKQGLADSIILGSWENMEKWMKTLPGRLISVQNATNFANVAKMFYDVADQLDLKETYEEGKGGKGKKRRITPTKLEEVKVVAAEAIKVLKTKHPSIELREFNPTKLAKIKPTRQIAGKGFGPGLKLKPITDADIRDLRPEGIKTGPIETEPPAPARGKAIVRKIKKARLGRKQRGKFLAT